MIELGYNKTKSLLPLKMTWFKPVVKICIFCVRRYPKQL